MGRSYVLTTDSACDMSRKYYSDRDIGVVSLSFTIDGATYPDDGGQTMGYEAFYNRMRAGATATTTMVNTQDYINFFEKHLKDGLDIVYIAFSSGLSGSCNSAVVAASELSEKYSNKIYVVDSLCASMGGGLLVHYAADKRDEGMSAPELVQWAEANKQSINQLFTVDSLMHLFRGGRLSRTSAIMGTLVGIKPILKVNERGNLVSIDKCRGRSAALTSLVERMGVIGGNSFDTVFISHADCAKDAAIVEAGIRKRYAVKTIIINDIGPVIGAHAGAGTVALFFVGSDRDKQV